MTEPKTLETLLSDHKIAEEAKAEQRMKDFFAECKISTISQKLIRGNYSVNKLVK